MSSNAEEDSSSGSDDDETRRLQEAVISFENVTKSYPNGSSPSKSDNIQKRSKRNNSRADDTKLNELNTTPEFRFFISKKLGSYIDSITEYPDKKKIKNDDKIPKQDGFRLFSASIGDWLTEDEVEKRSSVKRKKKRESSSSESGEDERLMEAVIPKDFLRDIVKSVSEHPPSKMNKVKIDKQIESSEETDQCKNKKHKKCKHKNKDKEGSSVPQDEHQDLIDKRKHKKKKKKDKICYE